MLADTSLVAWHGIGETIKMLVGILGLSWIKKSYISNKWTESKFDYLTALIWFDQCWVDLTNLRSFPEKSSSKPFWTGISFGRGIIYNTKTKSWDLSSPLLRYTFHGLRILVPELCDMTRWWLYTLSSGTHQHEWWANWSPNMRERVRSIMAIRLLNTCHKTFTNWCKTQVLMIR